jgi:hypothetical protein
MYSCSTFMDSYCSDLNMYIMLLCHRRHLPDTGSSRSNRQSQSSLTQISHHGLLRAQRQRGVCCTVP